MFLDFKIVRSRRLIFFLEVALCLLRTLNNLRDRSSKYPILSTVYYLLLGYAVLNSYITELPSNDDRSSEWKLPRAGVILNALEYVRLFANSDLTELPYEAFLLFVQEK